MREKCGHGVRWGRAGEGLADVVAPELEPHGTNRRGGDIVGDSGYL